MRWGEGRKGVLFFFGAYLGGHGPPPETERNETDVEVPSLPGDVEFHTHASCVFNSSIILLSE